MSLDRMSEETKQRVNAWAAQCLDYWEQFPPNTAITEEMIAGQPEPPQDIVMDATALVAQALACLVEKARTGVSTREPSAESRLITADLLDRAVEHALQGDDAMEQRRKTRTMWDTLMEGKDL